MRHALALCPIALGDAPSSPSANYSVYSFGAFASSFASSLALPDAYPVNGEIKQRRIRATLEQFISRIDSLHSWPENWDDNGSAKPKPASIQNAIMLGRQIYSIIIKNEYEWRMPFISADEEGDVVFEWWYQDRNLTLDVSARNVTFSETRDADSSPKITMGNLRNRILLSKLRWLIIGA